MIAKYRALGPLQNLFNWFRRCIYSGSGGPVLDIDEASAVDLSIEHKIRATVFDTAPIGLALANNVLDGPCEDNVGMKRSLKGGIA